MATEKTECDVTRQRKCADIAERWLCAVIVAAITYQVCRHFFHVDDHDAGNTAILNAGLAYYTHQATGGLATIVSTVAAAETLKRVKIWQRDHEAKEDAKK